MSRTVWYSKSTSVVEELGLSVPDPDESLFKSALVMFLSFAGFGSLPLLGYVVFPAIFGITHGGVLFGVACAVTGLALFALGAFKGRFSGRFWLHSGMETLLLGGACATIAYVLGDLINRAFMQHSS